MHTDKQLVSHLTVPLAVDLDVGTDGRSYLVHVSSDVLSVARSRARTGMPGSSCRVLKKSKGVECPQVAPAGTTGTTGTTPD